jgi:hypothetical protein
MSFGCAARAEAIVELMPTAKMASCSGGVACFGEVWLVLKRARKRRKRLLAQSRCGAARRGLSAEDGARAEQARERERVRWWDGSFGLGNQ